MPSEAKRKLKLKQRWSRPNDGGSRDDDLAPSAVFRDPEHQVVAAPSAVPRQPTTAATQRAVPRDPERTESPVGVPRQPLPAAVARNPEQTAAPVAVSRQTTAAVPQARSSAVRVPAPSSSSPAAVPKRPLSGNELQRAMSNLPTAASGASRMPDNIRQMLVVDTDLTDDVLVCSGCAKPAFVGPVVLSCGHGLCRPCLDQLVPRPQQGAAKSKKAPKDTVPVSCPNCREATRSLELPMQAMLDALEDVDMKCRRCGWTGSYSTAGEHGCTPSWRRLFHELQENGAHDDDDEDSATLLLVLTPERLLTGRDEQFLAEATAQLSNGAVWSPEDSLWIAKYHGLLAYAIILTSSSSSSKDTTLRSAVRIAGRGVTINDRCERSLDSLATALLQLGRRSEASDYAQVLEDVDLDSAGAARLATLQACIARVENAAKEAAATKQSEAGDAHLYTSVSGDDCEQRDGGRASHTGAQKGPVTPHKAQRVPKRTDFDKELTCGGALIVLCAEEHMSNSWSSTFTAATLIKLLVEDSSRATVYADMFCCGAEVERALSNAMAQGYVAQSKGSGKGASKVAQYTLVARIKPVAIALGQRLRVINAHPLLEHGVTVDELCDGLRGGGKLFPNRSVAHHAVKVAADGFLRDFDGGDDLNGTATLTVTPHECDACRTGSQQRLQAACDARDIDGIRSHVDSGKSVPVALLRDAIDRKDIEGVRVLARGVIDGSAGINTLDDKDYPPLWYSPPSTPEIAVALLENGADPWLILTSDKQYLINTMLPGTTEDEIAAMLPLLKRHPDCMSRLRTADGSGMAAFHRAARSGDARAARVLVEVLKVDVNIRTGPPIQSGWTALHYAAHNGHISVVEYLVGRPGINLDAKTAAGRTPLSWAFKSAEVVTALLDAGADPCVDTPRADGFGRCWAVAHIMRHAKSYDVVRAALTHPRCNVTLATSVDEHGGNFAHVAAGFGNLEGVRAVVDIFGSQPLAIPDSIGWCSLHYAARGGHSAIVEYIISCAEPLVDKTAHDLSTPLAVSGTDPKCVELLLNAGANITMGNTPALFAMLGRAYTTYEAATCALSHRSVPREISDDVCMDCCDSHRGRFLVHHVTDQGNHESLRALVDVWDIDVNKQDRSEGETPLHIACRNGQIEVMRYLLGKGAQMNARDYASNTPILRCKTPEAVKLMLDNEGDLYLEETCNSLTGRLPVYRVLVLSTSLSSAARAAVLAHPRVMPLLNNLGPDGLCISHQAAMLHSLDLLRELATGGVDFETRSRQGITALDAVVINDNVEALGNLLSLDVDVDALSWGLNAPPLAFCFSRECAEALLEAGANPLREGCGPDKNMNAICFLASNPRCPADVLLALLKSTKLTFAAVATILQADSAPDMQGKGLIHHICYSGNPAALDVVLLYPPVKRSVCKLTPEQRGHPYCSRGLLPIHYAAQNSNPAVLQRLLALSTAGPSVAASMGTRDHHDPPLYFACYAGKLQNVTTLLEHGANPLQDGVEFESVHDGHTTGKLIVKLFGLPYPRSWPAVMSVLQPPSFWWRPGVQERSVALKLALATGTVEAVRYLLHVVGVPVPKDVLTTVARRPYFGATAGRMMNVVLEFTPSSIVQANGAQALASCGCCCDAAAALFASGVDGFATVPLRLRGAGEDRLVPAIFAAFVDPHATEEDLRSIVHSFLRSPQGKSIAGDPQAFVDVINQSWSALHYAAYGGSVGAIRAATAVYPGNAVMDVAMAKPFRRTLSNQSMWTPLHIAAYHGNVGAVQHLLSLGDMVNFVATQNSVTPLACCREWSRPAVADALLAAGADPFVVCFPSMNIWAIHALIADADTTAAAAMVRHVLNHSMMAKHFDRLRRERDGTGRNALHWAVMSRCVDTVRAVQDVLQIDVNTPESGASEFAPLHFAMKLGRSGDMVRFLLKNGALANATSSDYYTPLALAGESAEAAVALLDGGGQAMFNAINRLPCTALAAAASRSAMTQETMAAMLRHKSVVPHHVALSGKDGGGKTLLHWAVEGCSVGAVTAILDILNVDLRATNSDGYTAVQLARRGGHKKIENLLKRRFESNLARGEYNDSRGRGRGRGSGKPSRRGRGAAAV